MGSTCGLSRVAYMCSDVGVLEGKGGYFRKAFLDWTQGPLGSNRASRMAHAETDLPLSPEALASQPGEQSRALKPPKPMNVCSVIQAGLFLTDPHQGQERPLENGCAPLHTFERHIIIPIALAYSQGCNRGVRHAHFRLLHTHLVNSGSGSGIR